jgi:hypothetical protein
MSLLGQGFVVLWSGLMQGYERDFDSWHTIEHMPERLGVPGFLRGRRYMRASKSSADAMFILYEGAHTDTFRSPGLLARLNDPSEWTKRVQSGLTNFVRGPCRKLASTGDGVGGAIITIRVTGTPGERSETAKALLKAAPNIAELHGVTAVHVGQHLPDKGFVETAETKLRPSDTSSDFSFVVLVEGIGVGQLEEALPRAVDIVTEASSGSCEAGVYLLAYLLNAPG